MSNPITELVYIRMSAHPWGFDQKEARYAVKETPKMVVGDGVRVHKEEVGKIKRWFINDSVCGIERHGYCRPEDVEQMKADMIEDMTRTIAELQENLTLMKKEMENSIGQSPAA